MTTSQFLSENHLVWKTQLSGHLTYGPIGKKIKNKLENLIRIYFEEDSFLEIDTPLILHKSVLEQSGHWNKFQDPIIQYKDINGKNKTERLDKLWEEKHTEDFFQQSSENIYTWLTEEKRDYILPDNPSDYKVEYKSLMMKSVSGHQEVGMRPETATATYNNFLDMFQYKKHTYPIKVYQIGKSFRNEISTKSSTLIRTREFTQAEFHLILQKSEKEEQKEYKKAIDNTLQFIYDLGIPKDKIRLRQHSDDEKAFYALDAWDIEVNLNDIGWTEIIGIHDRGEHDLKHLELDPIPHIIEIAIGIDRLFYSIIDTQLSIKSKKNGKSILKLIPSLSPYEYAIAVLANNKPELVEISDKLYKSLGPRKALYHKNISVGKAYQQSGLLGIPNCITIDFQTLEDNTVTIRDRDTASQTRILISNIN